MAVDSHSLKMHDANAPLSTAQNVWTRNAVLVLTILAVIAYWNSLRVSFLLDDVLWIRDNPRIEKLWPPLDWRRPFGFWTFQLQYAIHGTSIVMIHVVNLAIHLGNAILIGAIATRLLRLQTVAKKVADHAPSIALAIAAIWVVHPLATAGVTYMVQRLESLMTLFYLLSFYALVRGSESEKPLPWYALLLTAFTLGVGTKEIIATCPFVLFLFDWTILTRSIKTTLAKRCWLYAAMFIPLVWMAWTLRGTTAANDYYQAGFGYTGCTPLDYLKTQAGVLVHYLRLVFWPDQLVFDYAWHVETNPLKIYPPGLLILALLVASIVALFRWPPIGAAGMAFFLILAPTTSFMPINDMAAEHRMYLPMVFVIALVVVAIANQLLPAENEQESSSEGAKPSKTLFVALAIVLVMLTLRTILRNHDYSTPLRLWRTVVAAAPHNGRAHTTLSLLLSGEADHLEKIGQAEVAALREEEALAELEESMRVAPTYYQAFHRRADIYTKSREYEKALALYDQSIAIHPTYLRSWHHRAMALVGLARYDDAIASLRQVDKLQVAQHNNYLDVEKLIRQIEQLREKEASKVSGTTADPPSAEAAAE